MDESVVINKTAICLMSDNMTRKIFVIPESADVSEKIEILQKQVYAHLIAYTNFFDKAPPCFRTDAYANSPTPDPVMLAIDTVQKHLKSLITHLPAEKAWIVKAADAAGIAFQKVVSSAKKRGIDLAIANGEMPFKIKSILPSRQRINVGKIVKANGIDLS